MIELAVGQMNRWLCFPEVTERFHLREHSVPPSQHDLSLDLAAPHASLSFLLARQVEKRKLPLRLSLRPLVMPPPTQASPGVHADDSRFPVLGASSHLPESHAASL